MRRETCDADDFLYQLQRIVRALEEVEELEEAQERTFIKHI
jgi:hypothetical protein